MAQPHVIYQAKPGSALDVNRDFYARLAPDAGKRTLVEQFVIPRRAGRAWPVRAGQIFRIVALEGPQVADLNVWNLANPRERFWASRSRQLHQAHVSTFDRLWSCLPYLRPMLTITADTVQYGRDADGAGCHDLLGTRCDPYVNQLLQGTAYDFHCHSNLVRAVLPYGLTEFDVHDVINVFQVTGLMTDDERYYMKACPARVGDHFELFAEIDLLMAASTCPGGDLSVPIWGPGSGAEPRCHPIGVEVFRVPDEVLADWHPPERAAYRGAGELRHGLSEPAEHPPLTEAVRA
jgi:uncharacterized protein YcgI (DUF1989 family)